MRTLLLLTISNGAYLIFAFGSRTLSAQVPTTVDLTIDVANTVEYQGDIADPLAFAKTTAVTPSKGYRPSSPDGIGNFAVNTVLGDIVAINGQPAKGLYVGRPRAIDASPTPSSGQAIADVTRIALREQAFEILQADGTPVGVIMTTGFSGGLSAAGQPSDGRGAWAIVGGTGAFVGVHGQAEQSKSVNSARSASMQEDPSMRRTNGGGAFRFYLHVMPLIIPQIVTTASGPAVVHSHDFSPVTSSNPAAAGEILSLFATGLGAVRVPLDPGEPFPANPPAEVNSPVQVTVNGKLTELIGAVGYPGTRDGYQVTFRLPAETSKGAVNIQLSAAWIPSIPVTIAVQ
jgi:hypothetical protein